MIHQPRAVLSSISQRVANINLDPSFSIRCLLPEALNSEHRGRFSDFLGLIQPSHPAGSDLELHQSTFEVTATGIVPDSHRIPYYSDTVPKLNDRSVLYIFPSIKRRDSARTP